MINLDKISTVVFDLGQVIVDLDYQAVIKEFTRFSPFKGEQILEYIISSDQLHLYETGRINEEEFIKNMNLILNCQMSATDFEAGWNKMLKAIPVKRLELMRKIGLEKTVLVLSNTNEMHRRRFDEMVLESSGEEGMHSFAHKVYYSHKVKLRKPDKEIFEHILKEHQLKPDEVLFLDDNPGNVESARSVGINAVLVEYPDQIFEILKHG